MSKSKKRTSPDLSITDDEYALKICVTLPDGSTVAQWIRRSITIDGLRKVLDRAQAYYDREMVTGE